MEQESHRQVGRTSTPGPSPDRMCHDTVVIPSHCVKDEKEVLVSQTHSRTATLSGDEKPWLMRKDSDAITKVGSVESLSKSSDISTPSRTPTARSFAPTLKGRFSWSLVYWWFEIAFCVVSLMSLVVVVVTLSKYDNQALPSLPMSITLNTFLAFFTTLTKASFMISVAEAISQWKWNMIQQRDRHLSDFLILDSASRSLWGSLWALGRFRWRNFATVGVIISLASMFTSPVTQQMIEYPLRKMPSPSGSATVPVTDYFHGRGAGIELLGAALIGTSFDIQAPTKPVEPSCSSAECTYPRYKSLAVCTKTRNITDKLTVTKIPNSNKSDWMYGGLYKEPNGTTVYNASLPNGVTLISPHSFLLLALAYNETIAFTDDPDMRFSSLTNYFVIWSNAGNVSYPGYKGPDDLWPYYAVEIALHLCVNEYESSVTGDAHTTRVVRSSYRPARGVPGNVGNLAYGCTLATYDTIGCPRAPEHQLEANITLADLDEAGSGAAAAATTTYAFDVPSLVDLSQFVITSDVGWMAWDGVYEHEQNFILLQTYFLFAALYGPIIQDNHGGNLILDPAVQYERLETYYSSLATSLSNYFRTSSGKTVNGTVWQNETFVHIRWEWLSLIALELLLSIGFLLVTAASTYRMRAPAVKSSALATLFAVDEDVRRAGIGDLSHVADSERGAEGVKVRLVDNRIVLAG